MDKLNHRLQISTSSRTRGGVGLILIRLEVAAAVNSKKPPGITTVFAFMTSKTSPEPKTSEKRLESPKPWNATNHAKRKQRKTRQMKSCKAVLWLFPIITNTGLLFFFFFFRGVTGKLKGITFFPQFQWVLNFSLFFFFCPCREIQLSVSQRESKNMSFPSVPQGTWENVGGFSLCWQHCVSVFTLHTSCHRVSEWDYPTHGVTNLNTKHTEKNTVKKKNGWKGWRPLYGMESEPPNRRLIVIVGVEVGEVCVGICLPGKLWVEVLISFFQDQVVFVEGLGDEKEIEE